MYVSLIFIICTSAVIFICIAALIILKNKNNKLIKSNLETSNLNAELLKHNDIYKNRLLNLGEELNSRKHIILKMDSNLKEKNENIKLLNKELEEQALKIDELHYEYKKKNIELENKLNETETIIYEKKQENENLNDSLKAEKRKIDKEVKSKNDIEKLLKIVSNILTSYSKEDNELLNYNKIYTEYLNSFDKADINLLESYNSFLHIEQELKNISQNVQIYKNTIVALGGSFSSGKSSFLNSLMENNNIVLPNDLAPTTYIPAYIYDGNNTISILSINNNKADIDIDTFNQLTKKNTNIENLQFNSKNLIKHFFVGAELKNAYKNICFLDTPGFDPTKNENSDRETAFEYIKTAKNLLWLINVQHGTTFDNNIKFLKDIIEFDEKKKIYVLITFADTRSDKTVKEVISHINDMLKQNDIKICGISPYTSSKDKLKDNKEKYVSDSLVIGETLSSFLKNSENNKNDYKMEDIKSNIKNIFDNIISKCRSRIKKLQNEINSMNNIKKYSIITKLEKDEVNNVGNEYNNIEDIGSIINQYESEIKIYENYISFSHNFLSKMEDCIDEIFNL